MALKSFLNGKIFAEQNFSTINPTEPLIIFLHGWGRSKTDFSQFLNDRNSIAFDFRGFGSSSELENIFGANDYAQEISNAIDELPEEQLSNGVVLVGHSLGGRVAACLGVMRSDIVKGIVFVGAPLIRYQSNAKSPLKFRLAKKFNKIGLISDTKMEENKKKYGSSDYRKASGILRESLVKIINESYKTELSKLACPVSFLWGENDTAAPSKTAYDSEKIVSNSIGVVIISGASHDVHLENPASLKDQIEVMLKSVI